MMQKGSCAYAFVAGYGHQFRVQLGGVNQTEAPILLDAIQGQNTLGQPFSAVLAVDSDEHTPVTTTVNLWMNEIAGHHFIVKKMLMITR